MSHRYSYPVIKQTGKGAPVDILKYMNSRDVADYLEEIDFEFNAMQAAYVVYINDWLTIDERIELWREIIDTMPDCEYERLVDEWISIEPSAYAAIESHIAKVQEDIRDFMANETRDEKYLYIPLSSRWEKRPSWINPASKEYEHVEEGEWDRYALPMSCSSFERCVEYLRNEGDHFERKSALGFRDRFDRHQIGRLALTQTHSNCCAHYSAPESLNYFMDQITCDGDFRPIRIKTGWDSNEFEFFVPRIPIPFVQGDILVDATGRRTLPFVYDRCATWSVDEEHVRGANDGDDVFVDYTECEGALLDRCNEVGVLCCKHGHMFAYGYEIDESESDSVLRYCGLGARDNYLNLGYYRGSFDDGKLAVLPTVSWFVMNETRDESPCVARMRRERAAEKRFADRGIDRPNCDSYDICALVNAGFRLR